mmetsp:Transcript_18464/g.46361  ORF Transcript_18464/g.46361 Transcript_18464/m.46361 type:complete len:204 (-) Transcript_18464:42-653(-)
MTARRMSPLDMRCTARSSPSMTEPSPTVKRYGSGKPTGPLCWYVFSKYHPCLLASRPVKLISTSSPMAGVMPVPPSRSFNVRSPSADTWKAGDALPPPSPRASAAVPGPSRAAAAAASSVSRRLAGAVGAGRGDPTRGSRCAAAKGGGWERVRLALIGAALRLTMRPSAGCIWRDGTDNGACGVTRLEVDPLSISTGDMVPIC